MRINIVLALATAALALAACGGGGSAPLASTTISGSVVKGPVANATVTVRSASTGAVLGSTTTAAGGTYSLSVPFTGDVVIEVNGGSYVDEATGAPATLATPLRVVVNANGGDVTGVVTPLTTMAYSYAFGTGGSPTATAFNAMAGNLAAQFQLAGLNLATTVPAVSGAANDYGRVLAGLSKYLELNPAVTLQSLVTTAFTAVQWAQFSADFTTAYNTMHPGNPIAFSFNGNVLNLAGTGAGGGTGGCGVNVQGTVSVGGFNAPLNLDYCITGIAAGSCNSGNASLSQALAAQSGLAGAANLVYTFAPSCVANPVVTINLQ